MDAGIIIQQMSVLLGIMLIGFIACKVGLLDALGTRYITGLVLNITLPALTFCSFLTGEVSLSNWDVLKALGLSLFTYGLLILIALLLVPLLRVPPQKRNMYLYMLVFANVGFMGYPVTVAIFGQAELIYAIIFNIAFALLVNSLGVYWVAGNNQKRGFSPRALLNVPLISAVIAMLLFLLNVRMPDMLVALLDPVGDMTTPLAMMLIGSAIGQLPIKSLFDDWKIYPLTVMKLLIVPILVWVIIRRIPFVPYDFASLMIIMAGTPVATNATMLAIQYGGDQALAAKGIFFSTICCVVTIPLLALFLC